MTAYRKQDFGGRGVELGSTVPKIKAFFSI
jgi:hypothetical protein